MKTDHIKTFAVIIAPEGNGFRAICPAFPACEATAPTDRLAFERVEDQIRARITGALARGDKIPIDRTSVKFLWLDLEELLV